MSSSTWDVAPVRARLAQRAVDVVAPDAWVIDDTASAPLDWRLFLPTKWDTAHAEESAD